MLHTRASLGDTRKYSMPFTILVIDDDPLILEMATELLAEKVIVPSLPWVAVRVSRKRGRSGLI